jgi:hypothetical protein
VYAAAIVLIQRTKTDIALRFLSVLGDVALIKRAVNSFTNAEYGRLESAIYTAIADPKERLKEGKNCKYLPHDDAPCILDLLDVLMRDPEAKFYPYHPSFLYKKISKSRKQKSEYPKFRAEEDASTSFSHLVWNEDRLNLSVTANIKGTVNLNPVNGRGADELQLPPTYPTFKFRNYAIMKDGILNINTLALKASPITLAYLEEAGLLTNVREQDFNKVHVIDLTKLPLMNWKTSKCTSARVLGVLALQKLRLQCRIKVLKTLQDTPSKPLADKTTSLPLTVDQVAFLEANGINVKNGSFSPPTEASAEDGSKDYYIAKLFSVDVKGCSKLPTIDEVKKKLASSKPLTLVQKFMAEILGDTVGDFADLLKKDQLELVKVRNEINRIRCALILANKWFDEFDNRDDVNYIEVKEKIGSHDVAATVIITLGQENVPFD